LDKFIQPAILGALAGEALHGYALLDQLKSMPMFEGNAPDSTGVYRLLNAMEQRGYVKSHWDTAGRPAKKVFGLTQSGRECLEQWLSTLDKYCARLSRMRSALRRLSHAHSAAKPARR
jgi:DNA-binding PadR family transcriptional regulator